MSKFLLIAGQHSPTLKVQTLLHETNASCTAEAVASLGRESSEAIFILKMAKVPNVKSRTITENILSLLLQRSPKLVVKVLDVSAMLSMLEAYLEEDLLIPSELQFEVEKNDGTWRVVGAAEIIRLRKAVPNLHLEYSLTITYHA